MNLVRTVCLRDGGFEPKLLPIGNTFDSLISMVAAGRGVVISWEIVLRNLHLPAAVNSYILEDSQSKFELLLLRKKESEPAATVNNFARILFKSVRRLQSHSKGAKRLVISSDHGALGFIDSCRTSINDLTDFPRCSLLRIGSDMLVVRALNAKPVFRNLI